jgi:hypothetical protein
MRKRFLGQPARRDILSGRADREMKEERRLVWRVLRHWKEITGSGRFPRRDELDSWLQREDGANCLLIAVEAPVELSHFAVVGVNLAVALCPTDTLAGVLLSRVPRVVSVRRGLMIEGGATLRGLDIFTGACCCRFPRMALRSIMCWARRTIALRSDETLTSQLVFWAHLL